jgi:hypothetical protein
MALGSVIEAITLLALPRVTIEYPSPKIGK